MTAATARKATRVTANDVLVAFLTGGSAGVRDLHKRSEIASKTMANAVEALAAKGLDAADLSDLADELFPETGSGERGRPAARVGETRSYSVQQVNDGARFIRLPVDLLGAAKGGEVRVTFADGRITVSR